MDLLRFQTMLNDPQRSKADLINMRGNALNRNQIAYVHAAEATLNRLFPDWQLVKNRRGGRQEVVAEFMGCQNHCESQKEAYVWLIERFIQRYPKPFTELDWETVFIARGPRSIYFAKSTRRLFGEERSDLAGNPNNYHRLGNGWFAKLVLSESQKIILLQKFAALADLRFGVDWDWNDEGKGSRLPSADELLREFEKP